MQEETRIGVVTTNVDPRISALIKIDSLVQVHYNLRQVRHGPIRVNESYDMIPTIITDDRQCL